MHVTISSPPGVPALLAAVVLTLDCGELPPPAVTLPTETEPLRILLVDRLAAADAHPSLEHIDFTSQAAGPLFDAGWYALEGDPPTSRWTGPRVASIELPVVQPTPLSLRLRLTSVRYLLRKYPSSWPQTVRILWNGEDLGLLELPIQGGTVELEIAAELQRVGPNRLEILPSYWLTPRFHNLGWGKRALGVRLDQLSVRSGAPQAKPGLPIARRDDGMIVQQPGSVVTFGLQLPAEAKLRGSLALKPGASPSSGRGRVTVVLTDAAGHATSLLSRSLAEIQQAGGVPVEADLAVPGEGFAALSLAFSQPPNAADASGTPVQWTGLRVEGVHTVARLEPAKLSRAPYNVIVVLLDSLRSDHVEPLGSEVETPNMRRIADRGVTFERMRSNSSWTRPAVASMFTSLPPVAHGVHGIRDSLNETLEYLPHILQDGGYHTVAVLNSIVVSPNFRMTRGFDVIYKYFQNSKARRKLEDYGSEMEARHVWGRFIEPQIRSAGERPFFVYLHELDPHSPYEPPRPVAERYTAGERGNFNSTLATGGFVRNNPSYFDAAAVEYLHSLYRAEVAHMDRYLGWILDRMDEIGLTRNTLLVLISDHGEEFYEHRSLGHGATVYEEQLRIPMLMRLPGVLPEGVRSAAEAQIVDVAPTILDLLGFEIPELMQGRSLLPLLEVTNARAADRPVVAHSKDRRHDTLLSGRWKLIRENPAHPGPDGASHRLFDLEADPEEVTDRWSREPIVGLVMRQELALEIERQAALTGASAQPAAVPLDPAMLEALQALGYRE